MVKYNNNDDTASDCDWLAPSKPLPRQPLPFPRSAAHSRTDTRARTTHGDASFTCRVRWRESHRVSPQRSVGGREGQKGRRCIKPGVSEGQGGWGGGPVTFRPPPCGSLVRSDMKTSCTRLMPSRSLSPAGCPRAGTMNKCPVQWSRYVKCVNIRCFTVKRPFFEGQDDSTWTSQC